MWRRAFIAVARKEFMHAARQPGMFKLALFFQCIWILMFSSLDVNAKDLPTVLVDQDGTAESRELVQKLSVAGTFDFQIVTTSIAQAREHIRAGRARAAIVIPPDYHVDLARGNGAHVLSYVDGTDPVASFQVAASVDGLVAKMSESIFAAVTAGVVSHSIFLFNARGDQALFYLPALIGEFLTLTFIYVSAGSVVRERETGTVERLLMTPLSATGLILGKLVPYFILGLADSAIFLVVMRFVFAVPIRGSVALAMVSLALYTINMLAIGSFFASGARNFGDVAPKVNLLGAANLFLSGFIWPISSLPKLVQPFCYLVPQFHMTAVMRGVVLRGSGVVDLLPHLAYLGVLSVVLIIAAVRKFNASVMV